MSCYDIKMIMYHKFCITYSCRNVDIIHYNVNMFMFKEHIHPCINLKYIKNNL